MINIFIKKSIIHIDCFTYKDYVYQYNPIKEASKFMPEWITKMQSEYKANGFVPTSTMKKCPAIIDYLTTGFTIPLWSDLVINTSSIDNSFKWQFADEKTDSICHSAMQWSSFTNPTENSHMKIISPWHIKTKDDVKFLWSNPFYNNKIQLSYHLAPAIIDFKDQHASHINMFIDVNKNTDIKIDAGTPLVHVLPMSDKQVKIKTHLIDKKEYDKQEKPVIYFINNYKKIRNDNKKNGD